MRNLGITVLSCLFLLSACQTTQDSSKGGKEEEKAQITKQEKPSYEKKDTVAPKSMEPLTYSQDWSFDWDLSQALRNSDHELVLLTPEGVTLNNIPDSLDKWLSRIKDNGGSVQALKTKQEGDMQTRGVFGVLLDVVLYLIGIAKEEATFSAVDDYNAVLSYNRDTGVVESIIFSKK